MRDMPTPRITPERWAKHDKLIDEGHSRESACRIVGINSVTSWRRDQRRGLNKTHQQVIRERKARTVPGQVRLKPQARRALDDFDYFRQRYLGRKPTPWQRMAVDQVAEWLEDAKKTDEKKYAVVNCPPGSGKSTLFTLDLLLWLICRDRSIRILIGSFTERQSKGYVDRLRRVLESTVPYSPSDDERRQGCVDGEATLAEDFGAFKPIDRAQSWNARELMVERAGIGGNIEKERTCAAFGMDGAFLGGRYDLVIWDDLVDEKNNSNAETREKVRKWYDSTAESRIEPGGLFLLQGQRLGPDDLYRYALDKVGFIEDYDDEEDDGPGDVPKKYAHVLYRAHDEALCQKKHRPKHRTEFCNTCQSGAKCPALGRKDQVVGAWDGKTPGACLLDPHRLPWRDLAPIAANNPQTYLTVYQQEDTHSSAVLVPKVWIAGGLGDDGVHYPGCWDPDRRIGQVPKGLTGELVSFCTVDPSPTKWWAILWLAYHPDTQQVFVLDLHRRKMQAPDFLDYNLASGEFTGIAEDWTIRAQKQGAPIRWWVVERNGAQRFMLQYEHMRRWQAFREANIIAHNTDANKADPEFGVQTISSWFRHGQIRLPGYNFDDSRVRMKYLHEEVTKWPHSQTDDVVMALWFAKYQLPRLYSPRLANPPQFNRPSWLTGERRLTVA